jgi:hypothetical protein
VCAGREEHVAFGLGLWQPQVQGTYKLSILNMRSTATQKKNTPRGLMEKCVVIIQWSRNGGLARHSNTVFARQATIYGFSYYYTSVCPHTTQDMCVLIPSLSFRAAIFWQLHRSSSVPQAPDRPGTVHRVGQSAGRVLLSVTTCFFFKKFFPKTNWTRNWVLLHPTAVCELTDENKGGKWEAKALWWARWCSTTPGILGFEF